METPLDATVAALGTTLPDLQGALDGGLSLDDVAAASGLSHSDLLDALVADLPGQTPGWDDVYALAEQVAVTRTSEALTTGAPEV